MFGVLKLFLRARYHDGRLLDSQEVQRLLLVGSHQETVKWTFLTYEEHPFLHVPWLALHPCGTNELMSTIFTSTVTTRLELSTVVDDKKRDGHLNDKTLTYHPYSDTYMLAWLSFVSPAIALKLPRGFSNCFFK